MCMCFLSRTRLFYLKNDVVLKIRELVFTLLSFVFVFISIWWDKRSKRIKIQFNSLFFFYDTLTNHIHYISSFSSKRWFIILSLLIGRKEYEISCKKCSSFILNKFLYYSNLVFTCQINDGKFYVLCNWMH